MESNKKKTPRVILYPLAVLGLGILTAVLVPLFSDRIDPYRFGHSMGGLTVHAFIVAMIVGLICDRNRRKVNLKSDKLNSA